MRKASQNAANEFFKSTFRLNSLAYSANSTVGNRVSAEYIWNQLRQQLEGARYKFEKILPGRSFIAQF